MDGLGQILAKYVAVGDDTKDKVLGASFIVANKDGLLYQGSAGRIGHAADSRPFTSESHGWIASMTKMVTATALMQIVEKGLIKLDDDTRPLITELANVQILRGYGANDQPIFEENTAPITLRQLLCHTSGMSYDVIDPDLQKWSMAKGRPLSTLSQTVEGWNTPLRFQPDESWLYGSGIDWAGLVLEKITGQSLGAYMTEHIFKPTGMHDTAFRREEVAERVADRIIELSYRNPDGTLIAGPLPVPENPPVSSGGSGLFSTAKDYAAFVQAVLQAGEGKGTLLRKESVDEMFRSQLNDAQKEMMRSLLKDSHTTPKDTPISQGISGAINLADVEGKRRKGTMTWAGMSNPQWWIDRETGIAAVLFVNMLPDNDKIVADLYDELERAVYKNLLASA